MLNSSSSGFIVFSEVHWITVPEVVEDQVRVLFRDILELDLLLVDVVSHHDVAQVEVGRGPEWKGGDDQPVGPSPRLVDNDEVCHVVCPAGFDELMMRVIDSAS